MRKWASLFISFVCQLLLHSALILYQGASGIPGVIGKGFRVVGPTRRHLCFRLGGCALVRIANPHFIGHASGDCLEGFHFVIWRKVGGWLGLGHGLLTLDLGLG